MKQSTKDTLASIGLLVLRLGAGLAMMSHGYGKLTGFEKTAAHFAGKDYLGLGLSGSMEAGLIVFAEFFCSLAVVLGLLTRAAVIPLIVGMLVAAFVAHSGQGFDKQEKAILYLVMFGTLFFTGPGRLALDHWIEPRLPWRMKQGE